MSVRFSANLKNLFKSPVKSDLPDNGFELPGQNGEAIILSLIHISDIELIPIGKINEAFERVIKADVKYRFVIDIASLV